MHYYPERAAYEKITVACKAATRERLALAAANATREGRQSVESPLARCLRVLASVLGHGRPPLEVTVPPGNAQ